MAKMTLWLLRPVVGLKDEDNPWLRPYEKAHGFVIRAESETEARTLATDNAGEEIECWNGAHAWMDPKYSTCVELLPNDDSGVVLCDYTTG